MINESAVEWLEKEFEKLWLECGQTYELELGGAKVRYFSVPKQWRPDYEEGNHSPGSLMELKVQNGVYG